MDGTLGWPFKLWTQECMKCLGLFGSTGLAREWIVKPPAARVGSGANVKAVQFAVSLDKEQAKKSRALSIFTFVAVPRTLVAAILGIVDGATTFRRAVQCHMGKRMLGCRRLGCAHAACCLMPSLRWSTSSLRAAPTLLG
eukprot:6388042-Amphidinium_carterae.2